MRKVALLACLSILSFTANADILPCDVLKARVDAKLQSKGVPSYTLEIVSAESISDLEPSSGVAGIKIHKGKEVGSCDGRTKRLIYTRGN